MNAYESAARLRKARAIAHKLLEVWDTQPMTRGVDLLTYLTQQATDDFWNNAAWVAGKTDPSKATRELVIALVEFHTLAREEAECLT